MKAADATVITSSVVIGGSAVSGLRRRGIQGRRKVLYGRLRQHLTEPQTVRIARWHMVINLFLVVLFSANALVGLEPAERRNQ